MSKPLIPFDRWSSGTNENSLPANDNSLRSEILGSSAVSQSVTAQPVSPVDGQWYIIPSGATGSQWGSFAEDSAAIFYGGTWYEFTAKDNVIVGIEDTLYRYETGSGWLPVAGGSAGSASTSYQVAASSSGALDLSDEAVGVWLVTLTENVSSILLPTAVVGEALSPLIVFTQDATGGRTVSGWTGVTWEAGSAPAIASSAGAITSVPLLILGNGTILGAS